MTRTLSGFAAGLMAVFVLADPGLAGAQAPAPRVTARPAPKRYVRPEEVDPRLLVPPPPADGSSRHLAELAEVHRLVATRTPERLAQAVWDDKHEDVSAYAQTLGPTFDLSSLPATAALLAIVDDERKRAEGAKAVFKRKRPWAYDPSIVPCDGGQLTKDPLSSFPSGHSLTGYSLGLALAALLPEKAQAIETRASDYAYSREICGAHYHSDTEASHVLAVALVGALWRSPDLAQKIAAARSELSKAGLTGTVEAQYVAPHLVSRAGPVSIRLDGLDYVNKGLIGVGRLPAATLDFTGDSLGSFSGLALNQAAWRRKGTVYSGTLYTLPDRGPNNVGGVPGTTDYKSRIGANRIAFDTATGVLILKPDGGLLLKDAAGAALTGKDPGAGVVVRDGLSLPSPTSGEGAGRISLDSESMTQLADGSFYLSDEYAAGIYYFSPTGKWLGTIQAPPALLPMVGGKIRFAGDKAPDTGRRNNQGLEGVSVTPDGKTLVAVLQSATIQDTGMGAQTRNNTRILVYDISKTRTPKAPVAHYVMTLPVVDHEGQGGPPSATAAVSELTALDATHFLVLARDSVGRGGDANAANSPVFKSVLLVSTQGATNLAGTLFETSAMPVAPGGKLDPAVKPVRLAELVNLLDPAALGRFGINLKTDPSDPMSLSEKWEGLALAPALDPKAPNDVLLLVSNDNDFITAHGRLNRQDFDAAIKPPRGEGENDNMVLVYRLTLPAPKAR